MAQGRVGIRTIDTVKNIEYFIVAGGASAGQNGGGGGGAGGVITGSASVQNVTLTITVGSGGASYANGSLSRILGGSISKTAIGGGRGGSRDAGIYAIGSSGGSGGGGCESQAPTVNYLGFPGTTGQGSSGGVGTNYSMGGSAAGGGGGGFASSGGNANSRLGGNGGNGYLLSWNNTGYAGGGAGSGLDYNSFWGRAGSVQAGYGGGGPQNLSANGRANSGGGGGSLANATNSGYAGGGAGGSGVVIIRLIGNAKSTTGSPVVTTLNGYTIYTFNGSGTITF